MKAVLNSESLSLDNRVEIEFLLGKLFDGRNDFDQAFKFYAAGNNTFRENNYEQISRYSIEKERDYFNKLKSVFTKEFFAANKDSQCDSVKPVFVVGMPRSGTTLTESSIFRAFLCHSRLELKSSEAKYVVDKMPHNFLLLGLIAQLFPNAHVIHIQRYPIDNCLSIYFQRFNIAHTYSTSLKHLGEYYQLYFDLMNYWNEVLPIPMLNVRYDELVSNQEAVTRQMIEFCGLDWDDQCLSFHKSNRDVGTPSYDQVSQPMYNKSSGRWRNYSDYIGDLLEALKDTEAMKYFDSL